MSVPKSLAPVWEEKQPLHSRALSYAPLPLVFGFLLSSASDFLL